VEDQTHRPQDVPGRNRPTTCVRDRVLGEIDELAVTERVLVLQRVLALIKLTDKRRRQTGLAHTGAVPGPARPGNPEREQKPQHDHQYRGSPRWKSPPRSSPLHRRTHVRSFRAPKVRLPKAGDAARVP